jgi:hypothetical protein
MIDTWEVCASQNAFKLKTIRSKNKYTSKK